MAYFKKKGCITNTPKAGDIVFFDWNLDGRYDHAGIFVKGLDNNYFETIEGNTSINNQSNGGQVMRRKRKYGKGVVFVHPKVLD
jgi:cell wall-associated NlpC family hydrolase